VTLVRLGVSPGQGEENDERLAELIRDADGVLEGVVRPGPLGGLYPVDDERTACRPPLVERPDAFAGDDSGLFYLSLAPTAAQSTALKKDSI
jgi:hypothetical protein